MSPCDLDIATYFRHLDNKDVLCQKKCLVMPERQHSRDAGGLTPLLFPSIDSWGPLSFFHLNPPSGLPSHLRTFTFYVLEILGLGQYLPDGLVSTMNLERIQSSSPFCSLPFPTTHTPHAHVDALQGLTQLSELLFG